MLLQINGYKIGKGKTAYLRDGNEIAFGQWGTTQSHPEEHRFVFRLTAAGADPTAACGRIRRCANRSDRPGLRKMAGNDMGTGPLSTLVGAGSDAGAGVGTGACWIT